jgi:hypothetical protein
VNRRLTWRAARRSDRSSLQEFTCTTKTDRPPGKRQGTAAVVKIRAIAISVRYRGKGGSHADEALAVALDIAGDRARATGCEAVIAVAWIHPRNQPSQLLCQRAGLVRRRDVQDGLQEWAVQLDLLAGKRGGAQPLRAQVLLRPDISVSGGHPALGKGLPDGAGSPGRQLGGDRSVPQQSPSGYQNWFSPLAVSV